MSVHFGHSKPKKERKEKENNEQTFVKLAIDSELIIIEVSQWNKETLTPHQIGEKLNYLIEVKESIDCFTWINDYILKPAIQKFFETIVNAKKEHNFKLLMQRLLVKEEWDQMSIQYPSIDKIYDWTWAHSLEQVLKTKALKRKDQQGEESGLGRNKEAFNLFKKLGLCKLYPMGLQLKDALFVRFMHTEPLELSLNQTHTNALKNIPYLVLHKLMAFDHRCRSELMPEKSQSCDDEEDNDDEEVVERIHPVDSLLAVLICSDSLLLQNLFSRLAKCQLAVPFILPDPFTQQLFLPLWAMRSIIKDLRYIEGTTSEMKVVEKTIPIINYTMPIISFIRFGKHQDRGASKSKILNDVISESRYDHFFNRDCAGGQSEALLGKGLVDMCWYLSSGKKNETFPYTITFLNLHGDAREYPQQSRFLSKISFMCVVLLTEEDPDFNEETIKILKEFNYIYILNDTNQSPSKLKGAIPGIPVIKLGGKNVKTYVRNKIKKMLETDIKIFKSLEDHCKSNLAAIKDCKIFVDEEYYGSLKEGIDLAAGIKNMIITYKAEKSSTKEELLPLQGDLWKTWASKDKELYRQIHRGKKLVLNYTAQVKEEKQVLRQKQLKYVVSLTPVMEAFITTLLKLGGPPNKIERNYFLQSLRLGLNNFSRDQILPLLQQYQSTRIELSEIHEIEKAGLEEEIMGKMKDIQHQMSRASFSIEHLLRELGQIYEAASQALPIADLRCLPEAAAELLIEGCPLELMDGDITHVPLRWVTAVITEMTNILGDDPKVFVLSVLGLQSSGKSTMLNTVFGLQFKVSTGGCTRGAFMQLLPLDEQLITQTGFSYVLIVDTEGLRAPERSSEHEQTHNHDNELATFVIGLANMTLINIYGEVPGDMDDILQTSVHAFLRMSQVIKYRRSCQFVHQNAESSTNTVVGQANFAQKLNRMTVHAAKEANVEGQYKTFDDVIRFNDLKDIHHFPGLWMGDPPMAPVNPGYSEAAQCLKYHIINEPNLGNTHISFFQKKISDLWDALLKENFVFSFKNTLEITAYNTLETQYSKWEWEFRAAMLMWERTEENEITTAELNTVTVLVHEKCEELDEYVSMLYQDHKSEMDKFFSSSKQSEILVQWKARFETKLSNLSEELKRDARIRCKRLGIGREVISKERNKHTELMTKNVQNVIKNLKLEQEKLHENIREKKLESSQLQTILTLFTPEYLGQYRKKGIITEAQEESLNKVVKDSGGSLTEQCLNHIMVDGEILSTEQVIKILNQSRQSDQELEAKFNSYWDVMLKELTWESEEPVNVEASVERALIEYDRKENRSYLKNRRARHFHLALEEKHFNWLEKKSKVMHNVLSGLIPDPHHQLKKDAQRITVEIFDIARSHLKSIVALECDFNPASTCELLHKLDHEIDTRSSGYKQHFIFTPKYKFDVHLSACGYAVVEFEKMAESFRKKSDPRLYLEAEIKGPLFEIFKNQYCQKKAEEGVANTLCAHFEGPMRTQVRKSLSTIVVGQMKNSEYHYFKSKMALKVKILTDLYHENKFDSYMVYVMNIRKCLEERLQHYTIEYCELKTDLVDTRLQILAKKEVYRLSQIVEIVVTKSEPDETNVLAWLKAFCENDEIKKELGVKLNASDIIRGYDSDSIEELNLENVKSQIIEGLAKSKENLEATFGEIKCKDEIENWVVKPHAFLMKDLVGCTEQCPFCGEQCDLQDADHASADVKHHVGVHRSGCLAGFRDADTKVLHTEFCPAKVSCTLKFRNKMTRQNWVDYNKYQSIYPKWNITPDITSGNSLYWMLFIGTYKNEIAKTFGVNVKPPIVPESWSKIKWEEVEANLKELYNL